MSNYKPSEFAALGSPSMSRWSKSELEWIALAYVQALANDGDTWKRLSREEAYALLTDEQKRMSCGQLSYDDEIDKHRFKMVADQITDSDGALGVRGFWNTMRLDQARTGKGESAAP